MYILHCKGVCDGSFLKYIWLFFEKNTKQKLNHPCLVKEYWISNIEGLYQLVLSYVTLSLHHAVLSSLLLPLRVLIERHVGCKSHYNFNLLVPSTSTGLISSSVQPWQLPEHSIQGSNAHGSVVLLSAAGTPFRDNTSLGRRDGWEKVPHGGFVYVQSWRYCYWMVTLGKWSAVG